MQSRSGDFDNDRRRLFGTPESLCRGSSRRPFLQHAGRRKCLLHLARCASSRVHTCHLHTPALTGHRWSGLKAIRHPYIIASGVDQDETILDIAVNYFRESIRFSQGQTVQLAMCTANTVLDSICELVRYQKSATRIQPSLVLAGPNCGYLGLCSISSRTPNI